MMKKIEYSRARRFMRELDARKSNNMTGAMIMVAAGYANDCLGHKIREIEHRANGGYGKFGIRGGE